MGEAKLRAEEVAADKARREQDVAQISQVAHFTQDAATFVNGMFATVGDGVIRLTFHEATHAALPPRPRAALAMTPNTAEQIAQTILRIVAAQREQAAAAKLVEIVANDDAGAADAPPAAAE